MLRMNDIFYHLIIKKQTLQRIYADILYEKSNTYIKYKKKTKLMKTLANKYYQMQIKTI